MNIKRYVLSVIVAFAFLFAFEYVWHTQVLMNDYEATRSLWRAEDQMFALFHWSLITQALTAMIISFIFTLNYEGKGILEGIRFGGIFGFLLGILMFGMYPYMPIPFNLALMWFVGGLLQGLGIGIICSVCYKS